VSTAGLCVGYLDIDQIGMLQPPPDADPHEAVSRGKPDPQGYLLAARALGVDPKGCLVIEDSPAGVAAARGWDRGVGVAHGLDQAVLRASPLPGGDCVCVDLAFSADELGCADRNDQRVDTWVQQRGFMD
jgi:beta-phosphoglucomutase-like phosphatase (HAD superfamily)